MGTSQGHQSSGNYTPKRHRRRSPQYHMRLREPCPTTGELITTVQSVSLCGLGPHPAPGHVPWPGHFVGLCLVTWKTQPHHNWYIHYQDSPQRQAGERLDIFTAKPW